MWYGQCVGENEGGTLPDAAATLRQPNNIEESRESLDSSVDIIQTMLCPRRMSRQATLSDLCSYQTNCLTLSVTYYIYE